jgi:hypothetical protein
MSDNERFDREGLAEIRKFFADVRKKVDWAVEMIDTNHNFTGSFRQELIRSMTSFMSDWQVGFQELLAKQQKLNRKIEKLH